MQQSSPALAKGSALGDGQDVQAVLLDSAILANDKNYRQCANEICKQYALISLKNYWGRRKNPKDGSIYYLCRACNDAF